MAAAPLPPHEYAESLSELRDRIDSVDPGSPYL